jgi:hypothetical protein
MQQSKDLKENYTNSRRYESAAKFHIREMELQRKYSEYVKYSNGKERGWITNKKSWFARNFSLFGLYYHLSRYGENYTRPLLGALSILLIATLYWSTHIDPITLQPTTSKFVGFSQLGNLTHMQKAFERSLASFYQTTYDDKFVLEDYVIRTISLVFIGILFVEALRRRLRPS